MTPAPPGPGEDAALVAALFAVDPVGLGGVALRAGPGPERDGWMAALRDLLPTGAPVGRAPLGVGDDRLLGGLDVAASLAAGRPVAERGVLAANDGGVVVLPMAERIEDGSAARMAAVLDAGEVVLEREGLAARLPARVGLVLLDEGREPEERPPPALLDRLAFLGVVPGRASAAADPAAVAVARDALSSVSVSEAVTEALCAAAAALGVCSLRPVLLAQRAARAHAALHGRGAATDEDVVAAARLVLVPRATVAPEAEPPSDASPEPQAGSEPEDSEPQSSEPQTAEDASAASGAETAEQVLAAVRAALPPGLLDGVVADNRRAGQAPRGGGAGASSASLRRGRPAGSRAGALRSGAKLDVAATLRAAAPWRRLRSASAGDGGRPPIRPEDFRIRRFVRRREAVTIFAVDASGSAAFQRLAEAKGAVELLLARAYVTRARVALVAFRKDGAEVLLAPTRSLVRARRSLADLPGGGGTPLASGLDAALALALGERARERTPTIVVLTDGRANVGRDGAPGREAAERDALAAAARIGEAGIAAAYLDVSPRPQPNGDRFARAMRGAYAPLPYADAARMAAAVSALGVAG